MPAWTTRVRYRHILISLSKTKMKQTYAEDALGANQLHQLVLGGADGVTLSIGLEVTEVTNVAVGISGSTVGLAEGVD